MLSISNSCGRFGAQNSIEYDNEKRLTVALQNPLYSPESFSLNSTAPVLKASSNVKYKVSLDDFEFYKSSIPFSLPAHIVVTEGKVSSGNVSLAFIDFGDEKQIRNLVGENVDSKYTSTKFRAGLCNYSFNTSSGLFDFQKCFGNLPTFPETALNARFFWLHIDTKSLKASTQTVGVSANLALKNIDLSDSLPWDIVKSLDEVPSIHTNLTDIVLPSGKHINSSLSFSLGETTNEKRVEKKEVILQQIITAMSGLSVRSRYQFAKGDRPDEPAQDGLGYKFGGKDTVTRSKPNGTCSHKVYGVDCSGMLSLGAQAAGLQIPDGTSAQSSENSWNEALGGANAIAKMKSLNAKAELLTGDLAYWSKGHIGVILHEHNSTAISILQSNGVATPTDGELDKFKKPMTIAQNCAKNLGPNRGPREVEYNQFKKNFKSDPSKFLRLIAIPKIAELSINSGTLKGETEVHILGTGFEKGVRVKIGTADAVAPQVVSENEIIVKTPTHDKAEKVNILVTNFVQNSPESDVPSNTNIQFEYKDEALTIDDFAYQQNDAAALSDLNTTTGDVGTVEVEAGQYIYVFGNGLKNATFKIPGTSEILTGTTVTIPASDALFATGKDVIKIQIPTSVSPGFSGPINTSKTTEGVTTQANSTRQIQIKSVGDYSVFTYFNVQKNIPSELSTNENCLLYSKVPDFYVIYSVSKLTINKGSDAGNSYLFKDYAGAVCTAGGGWENITLKNFTPASIDSKENYSLILRVQTEGDPAAEEAIYGKSKVTSVTQRVAKPEMCDSEITNVDYLLARHLLHKCEYDPMTDSWPCERTWTDWTTMRDGTPRVRTISNNCEVNFIENFKAKALQQSLDRI